MTLPFITDIMFTNKLPVSILCTTSPHQPHGYVAVPSNSIQPIRANPAEQFLPLGGFPCLPFQRWWLSGGKGRKQSPVPALSHRAQMSQGHSLEVAAVPGCGEGGPSLGLGTLTGDSLCPNPPLQIWSLL